MQGRKGLGRGRTLCVCLLQTDTLSLLPSIASRRMHRDFTYSCIVHHFVDSSYDSWINSFDRVGASSSRHEWEDQPKILSRTSCSHPHIRYLRYSPIMSALPPQFTPPSPRRHMLSPSNRTTYPVNNHSWKRDSSFCRPSPYFSQALPTTPAPYPCNLC